MSDRDISKFAPVSKAEREAAAAGTVAPAAPASPSSAVAPVPAPASAEDGPRFAGDLVRRMTIPLLFPIVFRGKTYSSITLHRASAKEVGEYFERLVEVGKSNSGAIVPFPVFKDDEGNPIPAEVIAFLDDEDDEAVMKAATDFLSPRLLRLRGA